MCTHGAQQSNYSTSITSKKNPKLSTLSLTIDCTKFHINPDCLNRKTIISINHYKGIIISRRIFKNKSDKSDLYYTRFIPLEHLNITTRQVKIMDKKLLEKFCVPSHLIDFFSPVFIFSHFFY